MADTFEDIDSKLHEIFGYLKNRLNEIEAGDVKEVIQNSDVVFREINSRISTLTPDVVSPFVGTLIDRVNNMLDNFTKLFKPLKKNYAHLAPTQWDILSGGAEFPAVSILKANLLHELKAYRSKLEALNGRLNSDTLAFSSNAKSDKLQFKLSVEELCGLLRIFKEADIIDKGISNREICRALIQNLSAVQGGGTSLKHIENSMSPSYETIDSLEDKLQELLKITHGLRKKKS
jgi:hypothetical protein